MLFSIKGFDDNGKNGVGQTFQQVLTGNWIEIHDSWMTLSRKNPTPEEDGGNYFLCYRPRFFDQVEHQTTYASMANKQFFTK